MTSPTCPAARRFCADDGGAAPEAACAAVAGPVADGRAELTNLDWSIDRTGLIAATGARQAAILNDLQAQGYALGHLDADTVLPRASRRAAAPGGRTAGGRRRHRLQRGAGPRATARAASCHRARPGTRNAAGPHGGRPAALDLRLAPPRGFAAVEDVLSGRGLEHVYRWLDADAAAEETSPTASEIMARSRPIRGPRRRCAMSCACSATVAGNLVLDAPPARRRVPRGRRRARPGAASRGDGIRGGVPRQGPLRRLLGNFAVSLVTDDFAALHGLRRASCRTPRCRAPNARGPGSGNAFLAIHPLPLPRPANERRSAT